MVFFSSSRSSFPSPKLPLLPVLSTFSNVAAILSASTGTKLERTLLVGRRRFSLSLPSAPGDRPREPGEALSSVVLVSKMFRRLRTAEAERGSEDMASSESDQPDY